MRCEQFPHNLHRLFKVLSVSGVMTRDHHTHVALEMMRQGQVIIKYKCVMK